MKSKYQSFCIFVFLLACIFFAISGSKCDAEQFTFNVPVEIKNLQNVSEGRVQCAVATAEKAWIPNISYKDVTFPLTGGNYNGIATVSLSIQIPWTAVKYTCRLSVKRIGMTAFETLSTSKTIIGLTSASPNSDGYFWGDLPQQ